MNRTWEITFSHYGRKIFSINDLTDGKLGSALKLADMMWDDIIHRNGADFNMLCGLKEQVSID